MSEEDFQEQVGDAHFTDNWADEITVRGHKVFTRAEFTDFVSRYAGQRGEGYICIGSNQHIEVDPVSDYLYTLSATPISAEDYAAFRRMFQSNECGMWNEPDFEDDDEDCALTRKRK
ncbi:MAG TPA: hypothetical protein V6D17_03370 [Candidatus Obscuribacterales bacterium]